MLVQSMGSISSKWFAFLIFGFFFIINVATSGGHFDSWDGIETFLVTEGMVLHHSAKVYPDSPSVPKLHFDIRQTVALNKSLQTGKAYNINTALEPIYIFRSLLLSAIAVPFYYVALFFSISPIVVVAMFVNPLILALISLVIFYFALEIHLSKKIAFILSLIFGVCSFAWSYVTTLVPQPLEALLILSSAFFIYKSTKENTNRKQIHFAGLGGVLLGLSLLAHPASGIVIPGFVGYSIISMWHKPWKFQRRVLITFLVMLGIVMFVIGFINFWRFGSFTQFGYGVQGALSVHHGWKGLVGLLVSPGKGIIFYFPIVILLPLALNYMYRDSKELCILFSYIIFVNWLFFGTDAYWDPHTWTGDIGWGPRYLMPVLPFITIAFGSLLTHLKNRVYLKLAIVILCIISFFVSLLGVLVWYQYGQAYGWEREGLWQYDHITFQYNNLKVSSWEPLTWFPQYSPIILHIKILMSDYLAKMPAYLAAYHIPWNDFHRMGLAPCPYDSYIYCKAGVMPTLLVVFIGVGILIPVLLETGIKSYKKRNTKVIS